MKKGKQIGKRLGISKSDMAELLEVKRSTWAKYVSGKCKLPRMEKLKLNDIVRFAEELEERYWYDVNRTDLVLKLKCFIEKQLLLCQDKQRVLAAKLEKCKLKYAKAGNYIGYYDVLIERCEENEHQQKRSLGISKRKAAAALKKHGLMRQEKITVKLLLLQNGESLLRKKLSDALSYTPEE